MAKQAWPKASGANPPVRSPRALQDTTIHLGYLFCYGDTLSQGFEVWATCGKDSDNTTMTRADVTCRACLQ